MTAPVLDILPPLRAAVVGQSAITVLLGKFNGVPSVHTRRPVPEGAEYPMIVIGPIIAKPEQDGINSYRPMPVIDITVYGEQSEQYRDVEKLADLIYALFHRQRTAITVTNWSVTQIRCTGPSPAPADSDKRVARRVTLTIELYAKA